MNAIFRKISQIEEKPHAKFANVFVRQLAVNAETGCLSAGFVRILPGGELTPHTHDVLEIFHILRGQGMALVNGEELEVLGGEVIIAPAGAVHGMKNIGEGDLELYAVFSPAIA